MNREENDDRKENDEKMINDKGNDMNGKINNMIRTKKFYTLYAFLFYFISIFFYQKKSHHNFIIDIIY